jgi:hypothetical protein
MFFFVLQATIAIEDGFQCVAKYNIGWLKIPYKSFNHPYVIYLATHWKPKYRDFFSFSFKAIENLKKKHFIF